MHFSKRGLFFAFTVDLFAAVTIPSFWHVGYFTTRTVK